MSPEMESFSVYENSCVHEEKGEDFPYTFGKIGFKGYKNKVATLKKHSLEIVRNNNWLLEITGIPNFKKFSQ